MKKFFVEYRLELGAFIAGLLGLYFLIGRKDLGQSIRRVAHYLTVDVETAYQMIKNVRDNILPGFSLAELLGGLLLLLALAFVIWRIMHHFSHSEAWQATNCPRCGGELQRIHRSSLDHFLANTILPGARRYRCTAMDCGWTGLRQRRETDRLRRHRSSSSSAN